MIEEAIITQAANTGGLTTLIGSGASMRFHPQILPQNPVYPAVTYSCISAPRETLMGSDPGLVEARYQFSAWDLTYKGARDLAEQLRLAFERWRGTVGSVVVMDTFVEDITDMPPELVNDLIVRQRACDFKIHYRE